VVDVRKIRVCVPIPARSLREAFAMIRRAEESGADIIELRLDYMGSELLDALDRLKDFVKYTSVPLIATNRHAGQGGMWNLSEEQRINVLLKAAEAGFTYVDFELVTEGLRDVVGAVKTYGARVIISFHDFNSTPSLSELERIVRAEVEAGADICKVVTMANGLDDSIKCLILTYEVSQKYDVICFAMGRYGLLSRVLSPIFGASFTYASLGVGFETASGQLTIEDLREIYGRLGVE